MNYAQVFLYDIANGSGCRTTLFVSGCTHHCKGCFNEIAWDFHYGKPFTEEVENELLKESESPFVNGFTILGGEPMEVVNQRALISFLRKAKKMYKNKTIWIYSGYTYEELIDIKNKRCHCEVTNEILSLIDVLVDGEFEIEKKDISLKFRGSSNQRLIDMKKTREKGEIVTLHL